MHLSALHILLVCLFFESATCHKITAQDLERIDEFAEHIRQCEGIPGMNLAAVIDGEVVISKGYGVEDLDTQQPVTGSTIFNIASITKHMVAVSNSLVFSRSGQYDWDTPVRDMIGDWFYFNTGYLSNHTTVRDVLAHKMGLAAHDFPGYLDVFDRREYLERFRFMEAQQEFRTEFWYNNNMYTVAGAVTEALSGQEWEDFMQQEFFDPLGMDDTTFLFKAAPELEGFATAYVNQQGSLVPVPGGVFGGSYAQSMAGEIASTAEDMAKWLNLMLGHAPGVAGSSVIEDIMYPELATDWGALYQKPDDEDSVDLATSYARGIDLGHYRGYRTAGHGGSWYGYNSYFLLLRDADVGVYTSANSWIGNSQYMLTGFVSDILRGEEPFFTAEEACQRFAQDRKAYLHEAGNQYRDLDIKPMAKEDRKRPLSDYVGEYGNFLYGNLSIFLDDDEETLQMTYGRLGSYTLEQITETAFRPEGNDPVSEFINFPGRVNYILDEETGRYDSINTPQLEFWDPPTFVRGLTIADAPPPNLDSC